jgi:hypothetical protein
MSVRFCIKCGQTYDHDDTIQRCEVVVEGSRCGGFVSPANGPDEDTCFKCMGTGVVEVRDPRNSEAEIRKCPNGCERR